MYSFAVEKLQKSEWINVKLDMLTHLSPEQSGRIFHCHALDTYIFYD